MPRLQLYDTTLRDGAQQEGISFSVEDKLKIAQKLDELGIDYIEGGWPGSNPKDVEFFTRALDLHLSHSTIVAFGSTSHPGTKAEDDANLRALVDAKTRTVTIVGKSWDMQVIEVLETSLDNNLKMIADSILYLKSRGLIVFFDAEHFFDGYKSNSEYSLRTLKTAADAGAECLVLCDTNGGTLPQEITAAFESAGRAVNTPLGIHAHNDSDLAVANTLAAIQSGAIQLQGTINGYGERCGNANLCSIIPTLKFKMYIDCISDEQMNKLSGVSRYVSELANRSIGTHAPYVGASAFAHKGGLHASAMAKWDKSYQHINPALVGNRSRVVVSELSGVSNIVYKARERGFTLSPEDKKTRDILEQIKLLESRGFQYEDAESSFELLIRRTQTDYHPPFELVDFMVVVEKRRRPPTMGNQEEELLSEATVKVKVGNKIMHTAAEGDGPVNALDAALRKALLQFYPRLSVVKLIDYKVRILEESAGTASHISVLIESSDGEDEWRTVGSSSNVIEASWLALADSLEYWLLKRGDA
ncbi:MAG: citramalate synthase [Dehalococcoidia bacterium]|nr:citramalate synthase [Dehalococcoidia bacterium]